MLTMLWSIILGLVGLAVAATMAIQKSRSTNLKISYKYTSKTPLAKNEQAMYWKLIDALPGYVVLAQVELSHCTSVKGAAFNTINRKNLDFVICNRALEVIAGIEIEDKSELNPAAQQRDVTKNDAMKMAGIKLIRWPATPLPSIEQIKQEFPLATVIATGKTSTERAQKRKSKSLSYNYLTR